MRGRARGRLTSDLLGAQPGVRPAASDQHCGHAPHCPGRYDDSDDEEPGPASRSWSEEPERMDDPLRGALPLSFGAERPALRPRMVARRAYEVGCELTG